MRCVCVRSRYSEEEDQFCESRGLIAKLFAGKFLKRRGFLRGRGIAQQPPNFPSSLLPI